jgi:hypothetical protein
MGTAYVLTKDGIPIQFIVIGTGQFTRLTSALKATARDINRRYCDALPKTINSSFPGKITPP